MKKGIITYLILLCSTIGMGQFSLELKEVSKVDNVLNSESEESLPLMSPDGRLYFVRTLFEDNVGGKLSGQDIWYSELNQTNWSSPTNDLHPLNTRFNNAVIGVADSGRTLYLNGSYSSKPDYQDGISQTKWKNGKWTRPKNIRIKGFNPWSPYVTYFVNGDIGVMILSYTKRSDPENEDLYVSFLHKDRVWSKPESLGEGINSEGDEFSPFIDMDGHTIFFSSDGLGGQGGADVFSAYRLDDTWLNWSTPQNLGAPVNSPGFDAYYTRSGQQAFFASNRESAYSDIYSATYELVKKDPSDGQLAADGMTKENLFSLKGFLDIKNPGRVGMVRILDNDGDVVQRVKPNDDGSFVVQGLNQYDRYNLDLDGQEKEIDDLKIFFVNENGSRVYLNEGLVNGQYAFETLDRDIRAILMAEVEDDSEMKITEFVFSELEQIPAGSSIYLYDDTGLKQETAVVNRQGRFDFRTMITGAIYKIELEDGAIDPNSKIYLVSGGEQHLISGNILRGALFKKLNGKLIEIDPNSEEGKYAYAKLRGEDVDLDASIGSDTEDLDAAEFGFEYGQLPPEGTKVTLIDEEGNVVEEAFTDENGLFEFKKLDPEKKYSMQLDDAVDIDGDLSMYLIDDDGLKVPMAKGLAQGGEFAGSVTSSTEVGEDEDVFSFNYAALPPVGSKVYLTDEQDNVIDSAYVDADGNFKFKKLKSDKAYLMKLGDDVDDSRGLEYFISDASGKLSKLGTDEYKGDAITAVDGSTLVTPQEYDKFSFDFENLPSDGSKVYLQDEDGNLADSSYVDANGNFRFKKLDPTKTYIFLVDDEDFDMESADLFSMDGGEKRKLIKLPNAFSFNLLAMEEIDNSEFDASAFQLVTEEEIPDSAQAYLYDEETNEVIEAVEIDEQGNFSFKRLDPDRKYSIKFDKEIDETEAKFFAVEEPDAELDIASIMASDKAKIEAKKKKEAERAAKLAAEKEALRLAEEKAKREAEELAKKLAEEEAKKAKLAAEEGRNVYFGFNEYLLAEDQIEYLKKEIIEPMKANPDMVLSLEGHTDNIGSDAVNQRMSVLRLSSVLYHLEIRGIDESRVTLTPLGESKPAFSNETEEGRAKNRRVEMQTDP